MVQKPVVEFQVFPTVPREKVFISDSNNNVDMWV
jgi:hypothetical protein